MACAAWSSPATPNCFRVELLIGRATPGGDVIRVECARGHRPRGPLRRAGHRGPPLAEPRARTQVSDTRRVRTTTSET